MGISETGISTAGEDHGEREAELTSSQIYVANRLYPTFLLRIGVPEFQAR